MEKHRIQPEGPMVATFLLEGLGLLGGNCGFGMAQQAGACTQRSIHRRLGPDKTLGQFMAEHVQYPGVQSVLFSLWD
jgi:hypothetical protein